MENEEFYNQIHDSLVDILGRKPKENEIKYMSTRIPDAISYKAEQWGWYDTEVRDELYRYIKVSIRYLDLL